MDHRTVKLIHDAENEFLQAHEPMIREYREARQVERKSSADIRATENALTAAKGVEEGLRRDDPPSLALPLWVDVLIVAALAAGETFVNYLAAEGLFQPQRTTIGITAFLTAVLAFIVFALAREMRSRRRDEKKARLPVDSSAFDVLLGSALVYLILSFFLRERYFDSERVLTRFLGSIAQNPWVVSAVLTVLAALGIVAAVYILSRIDHRLALAERNTRRLRVRLEKLRLANADATSRVSAVQYTLDGGARQNANTLISSLSTDGLLDTSDSVEGIGERMSRRFRDAWRDIATDRPADGGPPGHEAPAERPAFDRAKGPSTGEPSEQRQPPPPPPGGEGDWP